MSDNKLECSDSYILPQGPVGDKGPNGTQGEQGASGPDGPDGDYGPTGRSKIDIITRTADLPYIELQPSSTGEWQLLSTFIFPGNDAWEGDPTMLRVVTEAADKESVLIGFLDMSEYDITIDTSLLPSTSAFITQTDRINYNTSVGNVGTAIAVPLVSNLSLLPDTETPIGILVRRPSFFAVKIYSIELY